MAPPAVRLSDAEKTTLIKIVKSYPPIWDHTDKQYKNNSAKRLCWMNVSIDMAQHFGRDYDDEFLQKIYRNLKDVYQRKRKEVSNVEATGTHRTTAWPFYSSFAYLGALLKKGPIESYQDGPQVKSEEPECDEAEEDNVEDTYSNSESPQMSASSLIRNDLSLHGPEDQHWLKKRKYCEDVEMQKKVRQKRYERIDRYDALGTLIAVHLRELDELDPIMAEEFLLKVNSLQFDVAAKILEVKRRKT